MKNIFSVGQINRYVKNMFTQDFILQKIYVKGEVSNCKYHTSGHIYFSLKMRLVCFPASCLQDTEGDLRSA